MGKAEFSRGKELGDVNVLLDGVTPRVEPRLQHFPNLFDDRPLFSIGTFC